MDTTALATYFAALLALTAAPGPIVALLVARSIGKDARGATAFAAGLCLGDVLAVIAVAIGLGKVAEGAPELFAAVKYAGIAYLLWLAVRIWRDSGMSRTEDAGRRGWLASTGAGMALCLGNPSTLLIYMLLLPGVAPGGIGDAGQFTLLLLVTFAAVGAVFFGAVLLARQFNRVISSPASAGLMSKGTASIIAITSLWMLAA
ncbi:MAG: LysE family translocator [Rhizobiaceae bacterium]